MEKRAQVWIGIGVVIVLFLIFNALQSTKYYDDLDKEQQRALQELAMNVTAGAESGMDELHALLHWQARTLDFSVPDGYVSQEANHDPLAIIGRGWGLCFDRSYVFELLAESLGYKVRHVALASTHATHAVSEVKIDGQWVLFDTTNNATYQDLDGRYLNAVDLHFNPEPLSEDVRPLYDQFVYGVNSFHGGFAPPKVPYPDLALGQLRYNFEIIPYLPYNYWKVRIIFIGMLVLLVFAIIGSSVWKLRYKHA